MRSIGIDAFGMGLVSVLTLVIVLFMDIPSGILADKWSRKGTLILSAISLALCSVILGLSNGLFMYFVGAVFYGLYLVCTSGTYQAVIYDSLKAEGGVASFSKVFGRAHAIFLVSAGFANICSGFLAETFNYRTTFYITAASCALNIIVMLSLYEPKIFKTENKEKLLNELPRITWAISKNRALLVLVVLISLLTVVEIFKQDFGQLYLLRYISSPQTLGILWAVYAFTWALGSFIAHRFAAKLNLLIAFTVLPLVAMSFIDNKFSIGLFMVQAVAIAALNNQIQSRIQDATPSNVRASVLSVLSFIATVISIPASLIIGVIIRRSGSFTALRFVTLVAVLTMAYWAISQLRIVKLAKV